MTTDVRSIHLKLLRQEIVFNCGTGIMRESLNHCGTLTHGGVENVSEQ